MILQEKFNNFIQRRFVKDTAILQVGTVFSIGFSFIASVIFARILGSENYGIYSLIFALAGLFGIFVGLSADYTTLTLLPEAYAKKDREEIKNILAYYFKISLIFTVLLNLIAIFIAPMVGEILYHQKIIGQLARWILAVAIINIFFNFFILTLQSIRKIKYLAVVENTHKFLYNLIPILLVVGGLGLLGIVWGRFLAEVVLFLVAFIGYELIARKDNLLPSLREIFSRIFSLKIKKYLKLGIWITLDKKISDFSGLLPITLLGIFTASTSEVAYFKIALSYLALSAVLFASIGRLLTVQLPKSKAYGAEILKRDFLKSSIFSGIIYIFILLLLVLVAPFLVKIFYGEEYLSTIKLIYLLSLSQIFTGFALGYGTIFRIFNKLNITIIINIVAYLLFLLAFTFFKNLVSPLQLIILLFIFVNWFTFLFYTYFIKKILNSSKNI